MPVCKIGDRRPLGSQDLVHLEVIMGLVQSEPLSSFRAHQACLVTSCCHVKNSVLLSGVLLFICGCLILASLVSSYLLALASDCSQTEILLLSEYCGNGGNLLARFHYVTQLLAVFSICTWLVSIYRGSLQRAKGTP